MANRISMIGRIKNEEINEEIDVETTID